MVDSAALVKKVRFPRQLVPLSVVATQLVTFVAMLVVLMVVDVIVIPETRDTFLLAIPLSAGIVAFVAGVALIARCANVVFRDVEHLVQAVLLPWFFLTPILYRLEELPGGVQQLRLGGDDPALGQPADAAAVGAPRPAVLRRGAERVGRRLPGASRRSSRSRVGAWVFRRVDDRIAVEL